MTGGEGGRAGDMEGEKSKKTKTRLNCNTPRQKAGLNAYTEACGLGRGNMIKNSFGITVAKYSLTNIG